MSANWKKRLDITKNNTYNFPASEGIQIEHIIKKMGGVVDEESCDEEEIWNDDEVIDAVGIVGGSEEEIGAEEKLGGVVW